MALRVLGAPTWFAGDHERVLPADRRFQLLAVLAVRRAWVSRDELAELLWPDRTQSAARGNLRTVLLRAQRLDVAQALEQQADKLRWLPDSDLQRFEAAIAAGELALALTWYGGPLLQGFETEMPEAASAWLRFERERVAALRRSAVLGRMAAVDPAAASALAESLLASDPFDEEALIGLVAALRALRQPAQALHALEQHATRLAAELGLEPPTALREAARHLREGSEPPPRHVVVPLPRREPSDARFIGRRLELARLQSILQGPQRLVTIVGPGGIGKSSLARAALETTLLPLDGRGWVALHDLDDEGPVPARVAEALGQPLAGSLEPWRQVQAQIGGRTLLLVFDNAEHLGLGPAFEDLLAACPGLRLIVTSRARLSLPDETLLPLEGLPLPDVDETDVDVLRHGDAVRLFEARALSVAPAFDLAAHAADVVRLVHAVEGLPLAIELAAVWVRLLPVTQIVEELLRSPDLLDSGATRERSVRVSFGYSWRLLAPAEQRAIARLALLPGAFDKDMAAQVADAPLSLLAALVDKSLLRADGAGLFSLHPLLRQCAAEKADDVETQRARHGAYVGHWLVRHGAALALQTRAGIESMEQALPHVRAALARALGHADTGLIWRCSASLSIFLRMRGRIAEGIALFEHVVQALASAGSAGERTLARCLRELGVLQFSAGALEAAEASGRKAATLARRSGETVTVVQSLTVIGNALLFRGRFEQARPFFVQTLRLARSQGDEYYAAIATLGLGSVERSAGDLSKALAHYEEFADLMRRQQRWHDLLHGVNNIAETRLLQGDLDGALAGFEQGLQMAEAQGHLAMQPLFLMNLGQVRFRRGDRAASRKLADQALRALQASADVTVETGLHLLLARLCAAARDRVGAQAAIAAAVTAARRTASSSLQMACVVTQGECLAAEGDTAAAGALWRWVLARPETDAEQRIVASAHLIAHGLPIEGETIASGEDGPTLDGMLGGIVSGRRQPHD